MSTISMADFTKSAAPALNWLLYGDGTPEPWECRGCPFAVVLEVRDPALPEEGPFRCTLLEQPRRVENGRIPVCSSDEWRQRASREITRTLAIRPAAVGE
jgi:hypothetical protein